MPAIGALRDRCLRLAFTPDSRALISAPAGKVVEFWTLPSSAASKTFTGHTGQVYGVAWSPDGKLAATAAADKTARIWDVAKGASVRSITAHANVVYAVAFNPKGDVLATGGDDKLIKYWNVADGKELRKSQGHGAAIYCLAFHPDGNTLASGLGRQDDSHLERGRRQGAAQARRPSPRHLLDRLQPRRQATGLGRLWRNALRLERRPRPSLSFHQRVAPDTMTYGVAWSPDGSQLAVAGSNNKVYLLKLP